MTTELITRACGHAQPWEHREGPYAREALAKWRARKCPECSRIAVAELEARQRAERPAGKGKVKKGAEVKALPLDASLSLARQPDGSWAGRLCAGGVAVEGAMSGLMGLVQKLARKWLRERGSRLSGKVVE